MVVKAETTCNDNRIVSKVRVHDAILCILTNVIRAGLQEETLMFCLLSYIFCSLLVSMAAGRPILLEADSSTTEQIKEGMESNSHEAMEGA